MPLRKLLQVTFALTIFLPAGGTACAQDWPRRPITMVVPFAAGGAVDTTARIIAPRVSQILGQQVVVENIPGAGGMTAATRVAKAPPDGYQLLLGNTSTHAINQTLYKKPMYHAATDFEPVGVVAQGFLVLIARKDLPASTLSEFIAYARSNQSKMQFASAGAGTITHLACVLLNKLMGTNITHVPYRGTAMAMQDMLGGRIDFLCDGISAALSQIQGNTVKAIAFMGPSRTPVLPNLATTIEQGLPELVISPWNALFLPKGTPQTVVRGLANALSEALTTRSVQERIEAVGYVVPPREQQTPDYLAKLVPDEIKTWGVLVEVGGIAGSM